MNLFNSEIILVDDNIDDVQLFILSLKPKGLDKNVIHIPDGEEAMNFFFNGHKISGQVFKKNKSIVLLDINLPKIDGIEILRAMKSSSETKKTPVIILASSQNDPIINKGKELGADSYLIKPLTSQNFFDIIASLKYLNLFPIIS